MKNSIFWLVTGLALAVILSAKTAIAETATTEMVKTELYMSNDTATGYIITERQFEEFMDTVVAKYFPKGFTIYEAHGQAQEPDKSITRQATWVLVMIHEKTSGNDNAVEAVINEFRAQFENPEVMRTTSPIIETQFYAHK